MWGDDRPCGIVVNLTIRGGVAPRSLAEAPPRQRRGEHSVEQASAYRVAEERSSMQDLVAGVPRNSSTGVAE